MGYYSQKRESKRQSHSDENSEHSYQKLHWMQAKRAKASSDLKGSRDSCPSAPASCVQPIIDLLCELIPAIWNDTPALYA